MVLKIDLKLFVFLLLFYFTNQLKIYLYIMFFLILHEIGHLIMALILKVHIQSIKISPMGCSMGLDLQNTKSKVKEILVFFTGPMINIICVIVCNIFKINNCIILYSNLLIALFNFMPIYPLDGGRILKAIFDIIYDEEKSSKIVCFFSDIMMILLTLFSSICLFYTRNIAIFLIMIYLWYVFSKEIVNLKYILLKKYMV